ncbi:MAG TPA: ROK family protein, partial [Bryobacteraceae bacterium]
MGAYSIGVDLGGTNLRVAAIDAQGHVLVKVSVPAIFNAGPERVVADIVRVINGVRSEVGGTGLRGVGIGVPGFIDIADGVVLGSANLPGFQGFPVRNKIQAALGTPIVLENDANAAALGEMWMGAGKAVQDLMLITLGTGIGGGIISGGKVLHGFLG